MKIRAIDLSTLNVAAPPPRSTYYPHNSYVVARIRTDEGLEGLGYTLMVGGNGASAVRAYLQDNLVPLLLGEDPLQIGRLWHKMYDADRGIRKKGIPMYGLSAIDIGLWDILGKSVGRPLWQLWGGVTDRVPVYGGGGFLSYSIDDLVKEAEATLAIGARHYKMKIGGAPLPDIMENVKRVAALRKAIGDGVKILVDANQRLDVHTNVRLANLIEQYDIFWYEEPVYADNIGQCAEVARRIGIPVATGENEYTRYGFRDLVEQRAAAILNPDIMRCGGFSELIKVRTSPPPTTSGSRRISRPSFRYTCWLRYRTRCSPNGRSPVRRCGRKSRCSTTAASASPRVPVMEWLSAKRRSQSSPCESRRQVTQIATLRSAECMSVPPPFFSAAFHTRFFPALLLSRLGLGERERAHLQPTSRR